MARLGRSQPVNVVYSDNSSGGLIPIEATSPTALSAKASLKLAETLSAKAATSFSCKGTLTTSNHLVTFTAKSPISFSSTANAFSVSAVVLRIFTPPNNLENPPTLPDWHVGNKLFRHYKNRPVGRNVYIYSDNTVSEVDPDGYSTLWRESDRTSGTIANAPHVLRCFFGGHDGEVVSTAEATLLTSAGYVVT